MITLLLFLVFLACLGITAAWIAENPGHVVIHWFDYQIDTSFAFLIALALVAALTIAYAYILLRRIALAPEHFSRRRNLKQYEKGLTALTYSVAALASADTKEAEAHTRKAEKMLGRTPLTLLLSAQIARSQGNDAKTRMLLAQMLEHQETEYLAARYLSDSASKQQQLPQALELAQRAHALNPKGIAQVVSLHMRMEQWQEALLTIDKGMRKGQIARADMRRYKGIVYLQQGMQMRETGQQVAALEAVRQCLKALPDFPPCVIFAARALAASGKERQAIKIIFRAWKASPHPQLTEAFRTIIATEPKEQQMKQMKRLVSYRPDVPEGQIALAQLAIQQKEWDTARQALTQALARSETVHACTLMAEVEKGAFPDFDLGSKWIARSATAAPDPTWICNACGSATAHWDAHCPACTGFDTLEWKQRDIKFAGY